MFYIIGKACQCAYLSIAAMVKNMHFEWDEEKRKTNIHKHGFDFRDAWKVFKSPLLVGLDDRYDYGEERLIGIGMLEGRFVVVIFTETDDAIRIISMMKALSHEKKRYQQYLGNQLGFDRFPDG